MRRFKNILYVREAALENESSTPRAVIDLARANNARLTLCDVSAELPRSFMNLSDTLRKLRLAQLQKVLNDVDHEGVEIETLLLEGIPFLEVIRQVLRGGHDLLIKDAEPSGLLSTSLSANDMHLLRKAPCPVWIARSDNFGSYRSIVAAIDVDDSQPKNAEINQLILDLSTSLAMENDCILHVVHACYLPDESLLRSALALLGPDQFDKSLVDLKQWREAAVEKLLSERDMSGIRYQQHVEIARPSKLILDKADQLDADLVVMGTVARTGIPGFFIGNTAELILSKLGSSVLTVKPTGFMSPVN